MEIPQAFIEEVIEAAGTNVGGDEEDQVRAMIRRVLADSDGDPEDLGVLCFVAGRTYQMDQTMITIRMTPQMVSGFLHYLVEGDT